MWSKIDRGTFLGRAIETGGRMELCTCLPPSLGVLWGLDTGGMRKRRLVEFCCRCPDWDKM